MAVAPAPTLTPKMEAAIAKYDTDADGRFSHKEVAAIVLEMQGEKQKKGALCKLVTVLSLALLLALGANFGLIFVGVEITKDTSASRATGVITTKNNPSQAVLTGELSAPVAVFAPTRRRLHSVHGRTLVSMASVAKCDSTISAAKQAHKYAGGIELSRPEAKGETTYFGGEAVKESTASDGSKVYHVKATSGSQEYTVIPDAKNGGTSCQALEQVTSAGTGRELQEEEERLLVQEEEERGEPPRRVLVEPTPEQQQAIIGYYRARRQLLSAEQASTSRGEVQDEKHPRRIDGCFVYHCFAGDEDCATPSDPAMCIAWAEHVPPESSRCEQPACRLFELGRVPPVPRRLNARVLSECKHSKCADFTTADECHTCTKTCSECAETMELDRYRNGGGECMWHGGHGGNQCKLTARRALSNHCFPASAAVITADGRSLRMDELRPGVEVLVVAEDGALTFEPIIDMLHDTLTSRGFTPTFSHYLPDTSMEFVQLVTESGANLTLSPGHMLPRAALDAPEPPRTAKHAAAAFASATLVRALEVSAGDTVFLAHVPGAAQSAAATRVVGVSRVVRRGAYNFHTRAGTIVVDGVVASVFTDRSWPLGYGHVIQPLQNLHKLLPRLAKMLS